MAADEFEAELQASSSSRMDTLEEICRGKDALHDKLKRLSDQAYEWARRGDECVPWKARYAALILLFLDSRNWWQPVAKWSECEDALKAIFGETDFKVASPTLEAVLGLAQLAGRAAPAHEDWPVDESLTLDAWMQPSIMSGRGAALRALLNLPDERKKGYLRPILILLSSKGAWKPAKFPFGAALPEPEALAAVPLANAITTCYPNRKVSVLAAETKRPDAEAAGSDGWEKLTIGDFPLAYKESHTIILGGHGSNCFAHMALRAIECKQGRRPCPWPDEETDTDGNTVFGVRFPDGRFEASKNPDEALARGLDRGVQQLRYEDLFEKGVSMNLIAGPFAGGTARAAHALTHPGYVVSWLHDQEKSGKRDGPCSSVLEVNAGTFNPYPMKVRLVWRERLRL